ncbi:MAG: PQQ-like beta-propeller repeat protein [Pirellulaceae bacterium]|nr:PQQ-like beta-propeller repeat protein [Pirellulaceae bacterium]
MFFWCAVVLLTAPVAPDAWPAFLGAGATAVDAEQLPLKWSPTEKIAWRTGVPGHGQSSPVIWGERVFLTSVEGPNKDRFHILCLDLQSGKELWRKTIANSAPVANSVYVSRAAPTPVVDSKIVIAQFESGDVVAFTHEGEELWKQSLSTEVGPLVAEFGLGASPCQTEDLVFILLEHDGPSYLLALDKRTGRTQWKAARTARRSWSSPAIVTVDGQPQVVVSSAGSVDGYQASNGELLWSFKEVGGNTGTTPIDCGDGRFLVAAAPGRQGENMQESKKSNGMMQIQRRGTQWSAERKWIADDVAPSWASPIVHQGLAYWINRVGVVSCFDASTGELVYQERTKQSCWATPYAVGDRIYFFGKDGLTSVIAAGRQFKVLAENQLWGPDDLPAEAGAPASESTEERRRAAAMFSGPTLYGFAVAKNRFVIRIGNQAFCVAN